MTNQVIYKYPLLEETVQELTFFYDSKILTAQMQDGKICIWAMGTPSEFTRKVWVLIFGTGQPFGYDTTELIYINTIQIGLGVWHIFYREIE